MEARTAETDVETRSSVCKAGGAVRLAASAADREPKSPQ
jgi:hypothetical protein